MLPTSKLQEKDIIFKWPIKIAEDNKRILYFSAVKSVKDNYERSQLIYPNSQVDVMLLEIAVEIKWLNAQTH